MALVKANDKYGAKLAFKIVGKDLQLWNVVREPVERELATC